jgi:LDH2 family malate/lactate/ureidoglycolate dehydrogenase
MSEQDGMAPGSVAAGELTGFVARLFAAAGLSDAAAAEVASGLVEADLQGLSSHGVMLVEMYIERLRQRSVAQNESAVIVSERNGAVVLDAGHALGHLTGPQSMAMAIEKSRQFGAGIVSVRHGFHFGTAGRYAQQATRAGCIGIAMCNTRPLMPAPGGAERVVGNNPLAIALPAAGDIPVVLDMATSEAAMGKIRMAEKANQTIPANWAVTTTGAATTNPSDAIAGMLLPAGGAKGFGLSFMIDLMCGLLSQGATGSQVRPLYGDFAIPYDCSHLFIAVDVAHFCDTDWFRQQVTAAAARIREGKRAPGIEQLFTPGEPEWRRRQCADGQIRIDPAVVAALTRLADELDVPAHLLQDTTKEKPHA